MEAPLGAHACFGWACDVSDEMPAGAGVHTLLRVSELPPDEQAEVKSAMALFHAFAEHQAGACQGGPDSVKGQARADGATFLRQWQTEAIILGWPAHDLFAAPAPAERGGLVYLVRG